MKSNRAKFRKILLILASLALLALMSVLAMTLAVQRAARGKVYAATDAPNKQVALVLGAKVYENERLSDMFRDRVDTAIGLYKAGKVEKILVSGDHGRNEYDEVNAAKSYILTNGVAGEDIFLDHAGFDTYDSVYRARDVFRAESMIIVTQAYHLPRALYIADKLGVDAVGVSADLNSYAGQESRDLREIFASDKAWLDVALHNKPKYLGEAIPLSGDGRASWD